LLLLHRQLLEVVEYICGFGAAWRAVGGQWFQLEQQIRASNETGAAGVRNHSLRSQAPRSPAALAERNRSASVFVDFCSYSLLILLQLVDLVESVIMNMYVSVTSGNDLFLNCCTILWVLAHDQILKEVLN
jgi:hypothetical protein